ncbi:MAG: hypothetical protein ACI9J2_002887 [Saprospiraceae bacterium]|jgi:hypothetical protein
MVSFSGNVRKMRTENKEVVQYTFPIGKELLAMNPLIGQRLQLTFSGEINCINCGRKTNKSFQQGYCFPCMRSLPETDQCIVRPETCHFHLGTCRDSAWGVKNCMQDHYLYFANSSGLKVGITRGSQIPTRWMDQGATEALAVLRAPSRYKVGQLEVLFKKHLNDRTDWRKMLKGIAEPIDLKARRDEVLAQLEAELEAAQDKLGWEFLHEGELQSFSYPVNHYPEKVTSLNLDKAPIFTGELQGIKGQYLIFDVGVINIRKYTGYNLTIETA